MFHLFTWTGLELFFVFVFVVGERLVLFFVCCSAVHNFSEVFLLSTYDLLCGTMLATIVMMSAASVQTKNCLLLLLIGFHIQLYNDTFVTDRRATARTTET